jgi:hypothetical protein
MAGVAIFQRLTLGSNSILTETGRLDAMDNAKKRVITYTGRGKNTPQEVAVSMFTKELQDLLDRHYEVREGNASVEAGPSHFAARVVKGTKTKVVNAKGVRYARWYSGTPVEVQVDPDGKIIARGPSGDVELPNRIRSGLHKSREVDTYTLCGVLTWVSPTKVDHTTKKQADFHGGSKPNLVIYDLVTGTEPVDYTTRYANLRDLCTKNRWEADDQRSSLYPVESTETYPQTSDSSTKWTGVVATSNADKWPLVILNESEYFVIVGGNEDRDRVSLIKHSDTDGLVPHGTARVPKSMRDTIRDLCIYNSSYSDKRNYTKRQSSDFGQKANTLKWMHPKDYFVVSVNRGVLLKVELGKDVQSVEVS